jgi:hypothetical protein
MIHLTDFASQIFKQETLLFSLDNRGTIANVITTMDKINDLITSTIVSAQPSARAKCVLHSSIRKALGLAKKTTNKYYTATDMSSVYCITMGVCFSSNWSQLF